MIISVLKKIWQQTSRVLINILSWLTGRNVKQGSAVKPNDNAFMSPAASTRPEAQGQIATEGGLEVETYWISELDQQREKQGVKPGRRICFISGAMLYCSTGSSGVELAPAITMFQNTWMGVKSIGVKANENRTKVIKTGNEIIVGWYEDEGLPSLNQQIINCMSLYIDDFSREDCDTLFDEIKKWYRDNNNKELGDKEVARTLALGLGKIPAEHFLISAALSGGSAFFRHTSLGRQLRQIACNQVDIRLNPQDFAILSKGDSHLGIMTFEGLAEKRARNNIKDYRLDTLIRRPGDEQQNPSP